MAFIPNVSPQDIISSSTWGNPIRDQVISTVATSSSLSAITSPANGQHAYLQDTDMIVSHNGTSWVYGPGQVVCRGNRTSSSSTTTSEVGVIRIQYAFQAGIYYTIYTSPLILNSTAGDDYVYARLRYEVGGTPSTSSTILTTVIGRTGLAQSAIPIISPITFANDSTVGVLLSVGRYAGSGTVGLLANSSNPNIDLIIMSHTKDPGDTGIDI